MGSNCTYRIRGCGEECGGHECASTDGGESCGVDGASIEVICGPGDEDCDDIYGACKWNSKAKS
jgi:hypothetical protein